MLGNIFKAIWTFGKNHSGKLLAGAAVVAEGFALWFMHKRAPIVRKKLDELPAGASKWEKVKVAGSIYWPVALMFAASSGFIIGGYMNGEAKAAAWANVAMATSAQLQKTDQKMIETLGEDKAKQFHEDLAKEMMQQKPMKVEEIVPTVHGADIFYDKLSGRYFTSSVDYIQQCTAKINNRMLNSFEMWATINDWYDELDIPHIILGEYAGWNPDHLLKVEIAYDKTPDGRPCGVLVYWQNPVYHNGKQPRD
ncbi:DUF6353 family protein [Pseudobutyrivibrio sp.]